MSYNTAKPYLACYLILRRGNKVAFVLRSGTDWMNGHYGLVSGKVEDGESAMSAAVREAKEEAGIVIDPNDLHHAITVHRNEPSKQAKDWLDIYFEVTKWKGEPYNAEPDVHSELTWFSLDNLPKKITSVKFALEQLQAGKQYAEYGWEKA